MKRVKNAIMIKSWKLHYIFGGLLILTATWLGYFIGYSHTPYDVKTGLLVINGEVFRGQKFLPDHSDDIQDFVKSNGRIQVRYRKKTVEEESIQYIPANRDHLDQVPEATLNKPVAGLLEKLAKAKNVNEDNAAGSKSKKHTNAKETNEEIDLLPSKLDTNHFALAEDGLKESTQHLSISAIKEIVTEKANVNDYLARQVTQAPVAATLSKACSAKHGKRSSTIPCIRKRIIRPFPVTVQEEAYIFTSKKLPGYAKYRPSLANGHIGTAVHNTIMCMNGLYTGYLTASHRSAIPSMVNWNVTGTNPPTQFTRSYELNIGIGVFSEISVNENYTLTQRFYAHRVIKELFVVEVEVEYTATDISPLSFTIEQPQWTASYDLTFGELESDIKDVTYKVGYVNAPETLLAPRSEVHILYDNVPESLTATEKRTKWTFLVSVGHTKNDAYAAYKQGSELIHKTNSLYTSHCQAWADVWQRGRIDIVDNVKIARAVYSSFFYIISSLPLQHDPASPFYGLSPSGLAFGYDADYWGHIFWDQDMWMYPGILMFHPDLARIILLTRERTYEVAKGNAKRSGDRGIRFPWESAATGVETSPSDICSKYEIHVTGDAGLAILNYLYMTNDTRGLTNDRLMQMSKDIADFFAGRLVYNQAQDRYEIPDVQGPDEDHAPVNNSAMTNALAKACITAPYEMYKRMGKMYRQVNKLKDVADKIYIPFDPVLQYHPEFDGYQKGTMVKQADVVLMGFPVGYEMPIEVRKNDMLFYEHATQPGGPAMTSALYSIGWLEVGDLEKANASFQRNFLYIRNEFQVWSETILGGAANFITGMGGFLQNMVFGYGGFRIRHDRLDFNPLMVPGTSGVSFVGLNYLGSIFDVIVSNKRVTVNVTSQLPSSVSLKLKLVAEQKVVPLVLGKVVEFQAQPCSMGPSL